MLCWQFCCSFAGSEATGRLRPHPHTGLNAAAPIAPAETKGIPEILAVLAAKHESWFHK